MSARTRGKTGEELVAMAEGEQGASDAYSFAEWLVDGESYYGNPARMPEYELEGAFEEAMNMWNRVKNPHDRCRPGRCYNPARAHECPKVGAS